MGADALRLTSTTMPTNRTADHREDAWESLGTPGSGKLLLTCEHASNRVPAPLRTTASDRFWLDTHWAVDIGARTLTRELARRTGSAAVLARFTRLICDANRPPGHRDFARTEVDGTVLSFNRNLGEAELQRRVDRYHAPYHRAVDASLRAHQGQVGDLLLLSIHSFTPVWNQRVRTMDVGVLASSHLEVGRRLQTELDRQGFETAFNQPYSALDGLIYAAERHGEAHGVVFLELELNQALICTPARATRVAGRIAGALSGLQLRKQAR
jgi:predicted N-formylglutamate amidohydrolase